jgi:hypothetical protein
MRLLLRLSDRALSAIRVAVHIWTKVNSIIAMTLIMMTGVTIVRVILATRARLVGCQILAVAITKTTMATGL